MLPPADHIVVFAGRHLLFPVRLVERDGAVEDGRQLGRRAGGEESFLAECVDPEPLDRLVDLAHQDAAGVAGVGASALDLGLERRVVEAHRNSGPPVVPGGWCCG